MKRLLLIAAATLSLCVLAGSASAADTSKLRVVEVTKGPTFPVKTYVLTLPSRRALTIHDISVTENGNSVVSPTLVPASEATKTKFGVVLLIDTSWSMRGKPIQTAIKAAQAFAAQRNPNEQLGVIQFDKTPRFVLPLTASATKISAALARPVPVHTGTHIFDAVAEAQAMLSAAHIGSGSIVVLSDGADTGSTKTLQQVAQTAVASNTKIYTVGLDDASYDSRTLKALAYQGHGVYAKSKASELEALFGQLGAQLSSEYLLRYKSLAGPHQKVDVQVSVNGVGTAAAGYTSPSLPVISVTPAPYEPSILNRIWSSVITMIFLALLGAAVVAFLVIGGLRPMRSGLPARMAEFVSIRGLQKEGGPPGTAVTDETAPEEKDLWTRFQETLEIADIDVEPEWIVSGTIAATGLTFLLIFLGTGSPWWALFALGVPYISREWVVRTLARRRSRFAEQLPDALQVVASALRSGHSLAGSLAVVVESSSEPMKTEMQRVVADEQLGIPIERSMLVVAKRMASSDLEQLALVAELQRQAGGNAAEVVDRVAETVRERFDLKRLVQTLTMQGRMSRWIVSALPLGIVLILQIENPHYLHPLLASTGGKIVFGMAAAWAVLGSFVIKRIVEIEV